MGTSTKFCLKWNNFGKNVTSSFKNLLESEEFVDITLSAQGSSLKAHKIVLSASSQYFKDVTKNIPRWQHPVIMFRDIPFSDLQGIVEFIYHGEVSVDQECLASFLKSAQTLKIKGLTEDAATEVFNSGNQDSGFLSQVKLHQEESQVHQEEEIDDVEEEEEEVAAPPWPRFSFPNQETNANGGSNIKPTSNHHPRKSANPKKAVNPIQKLSEPLPRVETDEESEPGIFAGEIDDREEEEIAQQQQQDKQQQCHQQMTLAAVTAAANNMFAHFLSNPTPGLPNSMPTVKDEDEAMPMNLDTNEESGSSSPIGFNKSSNNQNSNGTQKKTCPFCFQQLSWHALSRHIRDMHKNNKATYVSCKVCGKMFRNKNSLGCHMWRFHKQSKQAPQSQSQLGTDPNQQLEESELSAKEEKTT